MSDFILVVTIVAFFVAAVLLVRACAAIASGSVDYEPEATDDESDPGVLA